jgi:UDP:flavonoid glycosyltransferase YjiC (YdhE family)
MVWEPETERVELPSGEGPLVLVAPSTAQDPDQRMLRATLAGLSDLRVPGRAGGPPERVRVLATTNRRPLSRAVRCGPETTLVNWLSYDQTMPTADLVICHAGHGTLVRSLAAGAGVRLPWRLLSPLTMRWAVQRALDPTLGLTDTAAQFQTWAMANDGAVSAATLIEDLAAG